MPIPKSTSPIPPAASRERVLVIRHGAFGDLVQASGALRDIREHHADAHIDLLVAPQYAQLMRRCPYIDAVIEDPRAPLLAFTSTLALLRNLRMRRFTRIYDLQGSDRTWLYRLLLSVEPNWSRNENPGNGPLPDRIAYAEQLTRAGIKVVHAVTPQMQWIAEDALALLDAAGIEPGYVVLVPGSSSRHVHKRWPHYAELARCLTGRGLQTVVVPGPDELEMANTLPSHLLLGARGLPLDWFQLAGVLREAGFVIGNDTGPTHLAAALGRPGLALFGPQTCAQRTGILLPSFHAIQVSNLESLAMEEVLARASELALNFGVARAGGQRPKMASS